MVLFYNDRQVEDERQTSPQSNPAEPRARLQLEPNLSWLQVKRLLRSVTCPRNDSLLRPAENYAVHMRNQFYNEMNQMTDKLICHTF